MRQTACAVGTNRIHTMAELAERGIAAEIERLKAQYNDGASFPQRRQDRKGERPIR